MTGGTVVDLDQARAPWGKAWWVVQEVEVEEAVVAEEEEDLGCLVGLAAVEVAVEGSVVAMEVAIWAVLMVILVDQVEWVLEGEVVELETFPRMW